MVLALFAMVCGLALLVWSADRFVEGSAVAARHFGMPPLLIGMVVVGFGTSAPEMVVSALASLQGVPGIALGNAYGSNITNIACIVGISAMISPIAVHSQVLRKELPILAGVTLLTVLLLWDGRLSRLDAGLLLLVFAGLMAWTIRQGLRQRRNGLLGAPGEAELPDSPDALGEEVALELATKSMPINKALFWVGVGLVLLIISSRLLVWGAVEIAHSFGVSDLLIGLTIVALGTSLPELASSVAAARKGEDDIALGNIIGSNLFNTLVVVGIAGMIHPMDVTRDVLLRDMPVMGLLTLSLFVLGYGLRRPGAITRPEGAVLTACYLGYTAWLVVTALGGA
ncbi:calcium/sodium antiporter [Megalodesulfovibrio gigas]|uniref:Ca2+/Na+ antiporter n=2 Tax=Megalodesulfovibrio gigas TaxID=879 RepID=T2GA18_MEGG1|nr:calcium/sodium antiporter [Megalodesulfovibrio gigas]AAZ04366.1 Ca2+/Na+ antiporter [Megalodesulfovibrio gigas]AGW13108.1 Ca2+/Na+ antiporter [Megalodesulfovibrio gigas DSM 1382 = ATCC 19364]